MPQHELSPVSAELANENPYLNDAALVEACEQIFHGQQAIPYAEYSQNVQDAYKIDMEQYARTHNFLDSLKLLEHLLYSRSNIRQQIQQQNDAKAVFVLGCGQGRLAQTFLDSARKIGITKVVFNDLIDAHIQATEQKIRSIYGSATDADGVAVDYYAGDFLTLELRQKFDAVFSLWYVSPELFDPSSVAHLRQSRQRFYDKLNALLIPAGSLIEDIPDPNMPGFYEIANSKTAQILAERGILLGEHRNFILSNWTSEQTTGFPYQIRYIPLNGSDVREKARSGFRLRRTEAIEIPSHAMCGEEMTLRFLNESKNLYEGIRELKKILLSAVEFPSMETIDRQIRKMTWWEKEA